MSPRGTAALRRGAAFLPFLALLAAACSVFCDTTDDPFITCRYAANVWAGHGAVFNIGERVEGFSSPLHLLLIVLLVKTAPAVGILFKAKLLGLAFAALAVSQTGRLARASGLTSAEALLAQLLVVLNINFAVAAVNGMETTLCVSLVLAALLAFLRETRAGAGGVWASAFWLFLAWAARPEALGIFSLLWLVRVSGSLRRTRPVRETVLWTAAFAVPALCLELARVAYYGHLVPNTYDAKLVAIPVGLRDGGLYLLHPLLPAYRRWSLPLAAGFWVLAAMGLARMRGAGAAQAMGAVVAALTLFVLRFGGDWMPGWRFLVPALPPLAVLQCHGLRALGGPRSRQAAASALVLTLWAGCAALAPHTPWGAAAYSTRDGDLLAASGLLGRKWVAVSRYLRGNARPGSVVAYSEMGYAGCKNLGVTFIDVRGLTDPEIARLPARYKGPWGVDDDAWFRPGDPLGAILRRRRPDLIIAFSSVPQMPRIALGRYRFVGYVGSPRDSRRAIFPALAYRRSGSKKQPPRVGGRAVRNGPT